MAQHDTMSSDQSPCRQIVFILLVGSLNPEAVMVICVDHHNNECLSFLLILTLERHSFCKQYWLIRQLPF